MRRLGTFIVFVLLAFPSFGDENSFFDEGVRYIEQGNYTQAIEVLTRDIESHPNFSSYYNLGVAYGKVENWAAAKWAFESSLKYKPLNNDAQYNAQFATDKINGNAVWIHPYSWTERLFLNFGMTTWVIIAVLSGSILGIVLFYYVSNRTPKFYQKLVWASGPAIVVFLIAIIGVYRINSHFNHQHHVVLKQKHTPLFISPNGVQVEAEINEAFRLKIIQYNEDKTWVKLRSNIEESYWVKTENVLAY